MSRKAGLRRASALSLLAAGTALVVLHLLQPGLSPRSSTVSEYALTSSRWLIEAFFLLLSAGSAAVAVLHWREWPRRRWLLATWTVGCVTCAVFPTDPGGVPVRWQGYAHGVAAMFSFAALWACALSTAVTDRERRVVPAFVCCAVPLAFAAANRIGFGAAERWVIAIELAWLTHLAVHVTVAE